MNSTLLGCLWSIPCFHVDMLSQSSTNKLVILLFSVATKWRKRCKDERVALFQSSLDLTGTANALVFGTHPSAIKGKKRTKLKNTNL